MNCTFLQMVWCCHWLSDAVNLYRVAAKGTQRSSQGLESSKHTCIGNDLCDACPDAWLEELSDLLLKLPNDLQKCVPPAAGHRKRRIHLQGMMKRQTVHLNWKAQSLSQAQLHLDNLQNSRYDNIVL